MKNGKSVTRASFECAILVGEGVLRINVRRERDVFHGIVFSYFYSRIGYEKKAVFLHRVVKTCQQGK